MHDPFSAKVKHTMLKEGKKYVLLLLLLSIVLVTRMIYEETTGMSIIDFNQEQSLA
jgi:hypothetical protein